MRRLRVSSDLSVGQNLQQVQLFHLGQSFQGYQSHPGEEERQSQCTKPCRHRKVALQKKRVKEPTLDPGAPGAPGLPDSPVAP